MSDKLQKTDSAIIPASKIADKIVSALKDDKPASTFKCKHPNHVDGKLCRDYAVGCHPNCACCMENVTVGIGDDAIVVGSVTSKIAPAERQQAKVANFGEMAERSGASPKTLINTDFTELELRTIAEAMIPTVTLPTETSLKNFDVKVVGEDGQPVRLIEFEPEVEMPDLRVGCGAEFPTIVNGKTLRCKKWRGHEGNHSDKLDGVPINWTNK